MAYAGVPGYFTTCLTVGTTPINLLTAVTAVNAGFANLTQNVSVLRIQSDQSNGANIIYVGDVNTSASTPSYGYQLLVHDQVPYQSPLNVNVPLGAIWVVASAAGCQINIEIYNV